MYTDENEAPNAEGKLWKKNPYGKSHSLFLHIHRMKGKKEEVEKIWKQNHAFQSATPIQ